MTARLPVFCRLGWHREAVEERRRFEFVNAQRRTIVGWLDGRTICDRCGTPLSKWQNLKFDDFSDAEFSAGVLAQLNANGEAIVVYPSVRAEKA